MEESDEAKGSRADIRLSSSFSFLGHAGISFLLPYPSSLALTASHKLETSSHFFISGRLVMLSILQGNENEGVRLFFSTAKSPEGQEVFRLPIWTEMAVLLENNCSFMAGSVSWVDSGETGKVEEGGKRGCE